MINEIIVKAIKKLSEISESPRLDAEILLSYLLKKPREYILTHSEIKLSKSQMASCKSLIARRASSEPIAYILGYKEFYGLNFKVTKNTLIPRPETELLVEEALKNIQEAKYEISDAIIDVGTGSGNIIISIAKNATDSKFFGVDISSNALVVAKQNAKVHEVKDKIKFIKSDLLSCFIQNAKYKMPDMKLIVIANLPYLSKKNYFQSMLDVKKYEPRHALYAGMNGLDYYKKLFQQIKILNTRYRTLNTIIEFSPEQKNKIKKLILNYFPETSIKFKKDLAQKWRLASFKI